MRISNAFPEIAAGGYSRRDGTVAFYTRVCSLIAPSFTVVDLGAGRAGWKVEDNVMFRRDLRDIHSKVRRLIAVDVDPAVLRNMACDEAFLMDTPTTIPLADESADLIISDHTLEHVEEPLELVASINRILKPGGWICARTPNRWGYIGIATNAIPNSAHARVLRRAQPTRLDADIFPTRYRMNTRRSLTGLFPRETWDTIVIPTNPEPAYFGNAQVLPRLVDAIMTRMPSSMCSTWHLFAKKRN